MNSLTDMFKHRVGLSLMDEQDTREYLTEREGIRIHDGLQNEQLAIIGAMDDLDRLNTKMHVESGS